MTTLLKPPPVATAPKPPSFKRSRGITRSSFAACVYGTGGIGKTTLVAGAPGVVFIDLAKETEDIDAERISGIDSWKDLRALLQSNELDTAKTIAIDSATAAEEMCRAHICATVPVGTRGTVAKSIEDYGFGKGATFLAEEWRRFLSDLNRHREAGRNIILTAHERIGKVPNPNGDDYIRYEPRLYSDKNASLMHITKEWADHVLFLSYDVASSDGKAKGSGSRTIYTTETATHLAKSRTLPDTPIPFAKGDYSIWTLITNRPADAAPEL